MPVGGAHRENWPALRAVHAGDAGRRRAVPVGRRRGQAAKSRTRTAVSVTACSVRKAQVRRICFSSESARTAISAFKSVLTSRDSRLQVAPDLPHSRVQIGPELCDSRVQIGPELCDSRLQVGPDLRDSRLQRRLEPSAEFGDGLVCPPLEHIHPRHQFGGDVLTGHGLDFLCRSIGSLRVASALQQGAEEGIRRRGGGRAGRGGGWRAGRSSAARAGADSCRGSPPGAPAGRESGLSGRTGGIGGSSVRATRRRCPIWRRTETPLFLPACERGCGKVVLERVGVRASGVVEGGAPFRPPRGTGPSGRNPHDRVGLLTPPAMKGWCGTHVGRARRHRCGFRAPARCRSEAPTGRTGQRSEGSPRFSRVGYVVARPALGRARETMAANFVARACAWPSA